MNTDDEILIEKRIAKLCELTTALYMLDSCGCGGPMHIVIDDGNVDDSDVIFCLSLLEKRPKYYAEWEAVKLLCMAIIAELLHFTPAQRWLWRQVQGGKQQPVEKFVECKDFEVVYDETTFTVSLVDPQILAKTPDERKKAP